MLKGSCNCGAVRFTVKPMDRASACHCGQCRKQSGHFVAAGNALDVDTEITGEVRWYASSEIAKRGFCPVCGCNLFWKANDSNRIAFALGAIDGPTGLRLQEHIFTRWKGDYYDIADSVPQSED